MTAGVRKSERKPKVKIECWCCERKQSVSAFRNKSRRGKVKIGRNDGEVILAIVPWDDHRKDGRKLCSTCQRYMWNEARDATLLDTGVLSSSGHNEMEYHIKVNGK
ncbi:hypothetical protein KAR91_32445 [Candidatus Pacearchaeota archaeon]|nr:hypothetical protein [Candidatus Pacearchaeota archaeon]